MVSIRSIGSIEKTHPDQSLPQISAGRPWGGLQRVNAAQRGF
ncbi:MAG: hypothetical protein RLZZ253_1229 [Verrucomicrobiota bacterium]|jgi:hypothetical protein